MTSIVETADFHGQSLPVVEHAGDHWFAAQHIGQALGYERPVDQIGKIYRRHSNELDEYSSSATLADVAGKQRDQRLFNEEGVMIITMLSRQPRAAEFRRWAVKVLKAYRHGALAPPAVRPGQVAALRQEREVDIHRLQEELATTRRELEHQNEKLELYRFKAQALEAGRLRKRGPYKPWTETDRQRLIQMAREGIERGLIASRLGRSRDAVDMQIYNARQQGLLPECQA